MNVRPTTSARLVHQHGRLSDEIADLLDALDIRFRIDPHAPPDPRDLDYANEIIADTRRVVSRLRHSRIVRLLPPEAGVEDMMGNLMDADRALFAFEKAFSDPPADEDAGPAWHVTRRRRRWPGKSAPLVPAPSDRL